MREFILGVIGKLIFSEIIDWSPKLEEIILRVYAKKIPAEIAPRALEEAQALLDGTPGKTDSPRKSAGFVAGLAPNYP